MPPSQIQSASCQWFRDVFGVAETSFQETRNNFTLSREEKTGCITLVSHANGCRFHVGQFTCPSTRELKHMVIAARDEYLQRQRFSNKENSEDGASNRLFSSSLLCGATPSENFQDRDNIVAIASASKSTVVDTDNADINLDTFLLSLGDPGDPNTCVAGAGMIGGLSFQHMTGICIKSYIQDPIHADDVIMVASQCNALEMIGPSITAGEGVSGYAADPTQGPQASLACPAATVYRNYFAPDGKGQWVGAGGRSINNAADIETVIQNGTHDYFTVRNGYLMPNQKGRMAALGKRIGSHNTPLARRIVNALRIGVQWSTAVDSRKTKSRQNASDESSSAHCVTQCFAWAAPCAYTKQVAGIGDWCSFATLILEGSFLATLLVGAIRAYKLGRRVKVITTSLGHGAFGNNSQWITHALNKAMFFCRGLPVDVCHAHHHGVVSHCFKTLHVPSQMPVLAIVERVAGEISTEKAKEAA